MRSLELYSEPFQPTGSVASEGVKNVLGRPTMDPLTLLVRESVQNSWDARREERGGVTYGLTVQRLTSTGLRVAREEVFIEAPESLPLRGVLDEGCILLGVYDRGTTGLGGPLRADEAYEGPHDFVDFVRNVGQPPDKRFGAGTFGYGKSAFYLASRAQTIVVHTRCAGTAGDETRLMGAALGPQFWAPDGGRDRPFTGRHWWGLRADDGVIDPVIGEEADRIAERLGLPGFEPGERGTTVAVIAPRFEGRNPESALRFMCEGLIWNVWPKMVENRDGEPAMQFEASWDGEPLSIPHPDDHPPLHGFARAMRALNGAAGETTVRVQPIRSRKPDRSLGQLALHRFASAGRPWETASDEDDPVGLGASFEGPSHHVALMRQAELIVKYLPGPELPTGYVEYAGVFITDPDVDDAFARSEPPAHDDWQPAVLDDKRERRYVNVAVREIAHALREFAAPRAEDVRPGAQVPLGAFAEDLAGLMPWEEGPGAGISGSARQDPPVDAGPQTGSDSSSGEANGAGAGSSSRAGRRPKVQMVDGPRVDEIDGVAAVVARFRVVSPPGMAENTIAAKIAVAVADGDSPEREPPVGVEAPNVLWWRDADGSTIGSGSTVLLPTGEEVWEVAVGVPVDSAILLELAATAGS